jgi:hypothetical protein
MEDDVSWPKSIAQILSSRPEFVKVKGTYSLYGKFEIDMTKKAFKDKVVNCLLLLPEAKADFKGLVDQYISLYEMAEEDAGLAEQRRKVTVGLVQIIEANISKSLCRYEIFNKENSKTLYKLRQLDETKEADFMVDGYF